MTAKKGVDISEWNGSVDFTALKAAGVEFVIIRCGYGQDYSGQQDDKFSENVRKAETAGMPYGVYHYSYARDAAGGKGEAQHVLRLLGNKKPAYGVWLDMEDKSTLGGDLAGAADAFCSTMESKGLYCGVYSSLSWWTTYLTSPIFNKYDRWCAQWNSTCDLKQTVGIWQFTDKLVIAGKNFDGNYAYKDYPALTGSRKETLPVDQNKELADFKKLYQAMAKEWSDNDAQQYSAEAREWATSSGLIAGSGKLAGGVPNYMWEAPLTREQFVTVLYRFGQMLGYIK